MNCAIEREDRWFREWFSFISTCLKKTTDPNLEKEESREVSPRQSLPELEDVPGGKDPREEAQESGEHGESFSRGEDALPLGEPILHRRLSSPSLGSRGRDFSHSSRDVRLSLPLVHPKDQDFSHLQDSGDASSFHGSTGTLSLGSLSPEEDSPAITCVTTLYQREDFPLLYLQKTPGMMHHQKMVLHLSMVLRTTYEGQGEESACLKKIRRAMHAPYATEDSTTHFQEKSIASTLGDKKMRETTLLYQARIRFHRPREAL